MPADFIKIARNDSTATHAPKIIAAVQQARSLKQMLDEIIGIARHNFNDAVNPPDFSAFEALFGVPTGKGQAVFTHLDGLRGSFTGEFQTNAGVTLIESVG